MLRLWLKYVIGAVLLVCASGCVVAFGREGNVTFQWTFAGRGCSVVPEVAFVSIQIPGEVLENDGAYHCMTEGVRGITLLDFSPGNYSFSIQGMDSENNVLYSSSGTFQVDGDIIVTVDLSVDADAPGAVQFTWRFPAEGTGEGPSCAQTAGPVTSVYLRLDEASDSQKFACAKGDVRAHPATSGAFFTSLAAGRHGIELEATDDDGFVYYRKEGTFTVQGAAVSHHEYTLDWNVGALPVRWTLQKEGAAVTCTEAGISMVYVQLRDADGEDVYSNSGTPVDCTAEDIQGTRFPYLYAGTYKLFLQARDGEDVLYKSDFLTPPEVTVTSGRFPRLDANTRSFPLVMTQQQQ